jgi:hypothetical protein
MLFTLFYVLLLNFHWEAENEKKMKIVNVKKRLVWDNHKQVLLFIIDIMLITNKSDLKKYEQFRSCGFQFIQPVCQWIDEKKNLFCMYELMLIVLKVWFENTVTRTTFCTNVCGIGFSTWKFQGIPDFFQNHSWYYTQKKNYSIN